MTEWFSTLTRQNSTCSATPPRNTSDATIHADQDTVDDILTRLAKGCERAAGVAGSTGRQSATRHGGPTMHKLAHPRAGGSASPFRLPAAAFPARHHESEAVPAALQRGEPVGQETEWTQ